MENNLELTRIFLLFFSAFTGACISYFFEMCLKEGNIFQNYLPWLSNKLLCDSDIEECNRIEDSPARRRLLIKNAEEKSFWYKPLGGCAACSNIWQGFILFWAFQGYFGLPIIYIVPYLVISNFLLRKMNKD
jgi:hypothetical protein